MRDVGTLVWVVLVLVGVIGSMISSVRKSAQAQRGLAPPAQPRAAGQQRLSDALRYIPAPQPPRPAPTAPQPKPAPPPARAEASPPLHPLEAPHIRRVRLFAGKPDLVRAVIAAEVLGKPRALSDEHFPR